MTWQTFHSRGETLRAVMAAVAERRDGLLPMDVDGVAATFDDELDLLAALTLKWHTRLAGQIERMLAQQPLDLAEAVALAWSNTAHELAGVRLVIDHYRAHPVDDTMARALAIATAKERHLLAAMAGQTSGQGGAASLRAGAEIEERARLLHRGTPIVPAETAYGPSAGPRLSLVERIRQVLAA